MQSKGMQPNAGRPRSDQAHRAILAAANALIREIGWRGVTIEAIARRASVGKNTVYRRWRTPALVLLEAFTVETQALIKVPDTGAALEDVTVLLKAVFRRLRRSDVSRVVRTLMAEAQFDEELRSGMRRTFIASRRQALGTLIERGKERREFQESLDTELCLDLLYGAMWYRLLNGHGRLDDDFALELVKFVLEPQVVGGER